MELYPFSKQRYRSFIPSISNSRLSPKAEIIATSKAYYNTPRKNEKTKKKPLEFLKKGINYSIIQFQWEILLMGLPSSSLVKR